METIETRTGPVAYEERGIGVPLVLLHANGNEHRDFDAVVPALARRFRTLALDWPGMGDSAAPIPPSSATAEMMAGVLEDFVERLALEPALFVGHSLGGYAAARLALRRPERVRALVLVDSGGFTAPSAFVRLFCRVKGRESVTRRVEPRFAAFYLRRRNSYVEQIVRRIGAAARRPHYAAVVAAVWQSFPLPGSDLRELASRIACPTLLVWGRRDPVLRAERDGRAAAERIRGSRLVLLDTGHEPFAEDPDAFLAQVEPFLCSVVEAAEAGRHEHLGP